QASVPGAAPVRVDAEKGVDQQHMRQRPPFESDQGFWPGRAYLRAARPQPGGAVKEQRHGTGRFDGLLFDQRLPDGSGTALLETLRARGMNTPALSLSADNEVASAVNFDAHLLKPIAADALLRSLRAVGLAPPAWDAQRALEAANGQAAIAHSLRRLMLAELPAQRAALKQAASSQPTDVPTVDALLHTLLGAARLTGALALAAHIDCARSLLADPQACAEGVAALAQLDAEIERLLCEAGTTA
ncbi:MAG: hypothetical protein ACOVKS_14880, partial [Aquimonas sp.]